MSRSQHELCCQATYNRKPVTVKSESGIFQDTVMVVSVDVTKVTVGAVGTAAAGIEDSGE